jgi:hypothetical protein
MKHLIVAMAVLFLVNVGHADSFEEHVLVDYKLIIKDLDQHGFKRPFADDVAKFALVRQVVEDGCGRPHSVSIVGMSVCEQHGEVMKSLGLTLGAEINDKGLCLKKIPSPEGGDYYSIQGPRANVCSAVALTLLWDTYVNDKFKSKFSPEESLAWNGSKDISQRISRETASPDELVLYDDLKPVRKKVVQKVNGIYNSSAAPTINKLVDTLEPLFQRARP